MKLEQLIDKFQDFHVLALPGAALLAVVVFILALWMGAALAGAEKLTFLKALALGAGQIVILLPAAYFLFVALVGEDMKEWLTMEHLLVGGAAILAIDALLVLGSILPFGLATPGQSMGIWLLRLPILALLVVLVGGLVFVGLGIYQASREPEGEFWLTWIGWILAAVVSVSLILFFLTKYLQAPVPRRTGS